ncbi:MAG: hypothetical protein Q4Q22_08895, partial [Methanosphaera sp.]|nr:hypothetical protein [Methanosphaera sp.]
TETLEAPAEAATSLDDVAGNTENKQDQAKAGDTEVENSEPINTTNTAANASGNNPNADTNKNTSTNADGNTASGNDSQPTTASSSQGGPNIQIGSAGDTSAVTEGQSNGGSDSNQGSSPQTTINVQPTGNAPQTNNQATSDNNGEISIDAARSLVEQFILENWAGNKVTLSYGTTVINDYGDKCYIYNMINDNGVTEGQASYNLRNQTIEIMDNSGAEYL